MDKKIDNDLKKFFNPKEIKNSLIEASLYLSFYEILVSVIVKNIADFYNVEFKDGKYIKSEEYNEKIINRKINGKTNILLSSCMWLIENGVISQDELESIVRIKQHRNRIAHDLPKFLFDSEYVIDKYLFNQLKPLTLKIVKWWIIEVEIPINPEFDGKEVEPDKIVSGQEIILDYIFNLANTDIAELERTINNMESQGKD